MVPGGSILSHTRIKNYRPRINKPFPSMGDVVPFKSDDSALNPGTPPIKSTFCLILATFVGTTLKTNGHGHMVFFSFFVDLLSLPSNHLKGVDFSCGLLSKMVD